MPLYTFKCPECRRKQILRRTVDERNAPALCIVCITPMKRDIQAENVKPAAFSGTWPLFSEAAGCAPHQRDEFMQRAVARGVPTFFDQRGRAKFEDRQHRRRYCQTFGFIDQDGGYADNTDLDHATATAETDHA